ncbi:sensor histidine kinase [Pseudooctadecabacter jejudonensis]|uniref:histidine kinase n=1 Tax=Pseudooctadecabacter jejudonensis TaxID=1391910 RepID=A0A1Y5SNH5_9RHOB|nr:HWE histidine kinase domain-containing protein [Pseudooctadecabacter jejudonensis]SLN44177.1 Blue-light-activated histidine kinase [Pseudooctadecabacter jejudonensis]
MMSIEPDTLAGLLTQTVKEMADSLPAPIGLDSNGNAIAAVPDDVFLRAIRMMNRSLGTTCGFFSTIDDDSHQLKVSLGLSDKFDSTDQIVHLSSRIASAQGPLAISDVNLRQSDEGAGHADQAGILGIAIHGPRGDVLGTLCALHTQPQRWSVEDHEALQDIAASLDTEIRLRSAAAYSARMEALANVAEDRFRLALRAGQIGTYDFDPQTHTTRWDDKLYEIWGVSKDSSDLFEVIESTIHPEDKPLWEADVAASLDPAGSGLHELEMRILRPDTGEERWLHAIGQASFVDGKPVRLIGVVRDVTLRKFAQNRDLLLSTELNHRVKNMFTVISGLISLTERASETTSDMAEALRGRVNALAVAHALIQPAVSRDVNRHNALTLQNLTQTLLAPHRQNVDAVICDGPNVPLSTQGAANLALVIHEMATNAAKYGALSHRAGTLTVSWDLEEKDSQPHLKLKWVEKGGPLVTAAAAGKGFGSRLIEMTIKGQMRGSIDVDWQSFGLVYTMAIPTVALI